MNIFIFAQHYPPEIGAESFRIEALVKALLHRNHSVCVMTAKPNRYEVQEKIQFRKYEKYPNLEIYRIEGGKRNDIFWRRPVNYFIFMMNSFFSSLKLKLGRSNDAIVFATSPPITTAVTALLLCILKKNRKFVLEIRDLWPDTLIELKIFKNRLMITLLKYIENILYRRADYIITVTDEIKNKMIEKGIKQEKIATFTNGLDKECISYHSELEIKLEYRKKYDIPKDSIVVSYVGNIGVSQGLEILVEAAAKMSEEEVVFLIVGEGLEKNRIFKLAMERNVGKKVIFLSSLPREKLKEIYSITDILFLQLRRIPIFDGAIPSKIFEYLGNGIPVIYGLNGIAVDILRNSGNGIKIRPGNIDDLINAIKIIRSNYNDYLEKAKKGREFVMKHYLREDIMERYVIALENMFESTPDLL